MLRYAPNKATKATYNINIGIMMEVATTLLTTKNLKGLIPETSIASICSVTFIEPNSAPICEPTFPAAIKAVTKGASALITAIPITEGSIALAPKSAEEGRDGFVNTNPIINPVTANKGRDL